MLVEDDNLYHVLHLYQLTPKKKINNYKTHII